MITLMVRRFQITVDRSAAVAAMKPPVRRLVVDTTRKVFNAANVACPVDTGNLRAHHRMTRSESATAVRGSVTNNTRYARAVHDGSRAHRIVARRRKALRFDLGGTVVYARSVRHPGSAGKPWLADAAQQVGRRVGMRWEST